MKFDLNNLNSMIESAEEIKELVQQDEDITTVSYYNSETSDEMIVKFNKIVSGIARKYSSKWVSREDLEQVLWVKVLEVVESYGGVEKTDCNLIATCCYRAAVDFYRKARKDYETNGSLDSELNKPEGSLDQDDSKLISTNKFRNQSQNLYMMVSEIIALFPDGSKEQTYIKSRLYNAGLMDSELFDCSDVKLPDFPPKAPINVDDKNDFATVMGYKGKKMSGGFITRERRMKEAIYNYLGR